MPIQAALLTYQVVRTYVRLSISSSDNRKVRRQPGCGPPSRDRGDHWS